jgi:two-component system, OmpR family, KDP operon response regulator KdpE
METVLVVEDEPNVRKLVSVNLAQRGYTVFEAKNGQEALDQLRDKRPSLMVLDIKLPDFSGWDVLNRAAGDPAIETSCSVLVMTASIMDAHVDQARYPNVIEVLIKPFSTGKLVSAVERALRSR